MRHRCLIMCPFIIYSTRPFLFKDKNYPTMFYKTIAFACFDCFPDLCTMSKTASGFVFQVMSLSSNDYMYETRHLFLLNVAFCDAAITMAPYFTLCRVQILSLQPQLLLNYTPYNHKQNKTFFLRCFSPKRSRMTRTHMVSKIIATGILCDVRLGAFYTITEISRK